jgi:hypothetical protein
VSKDFDGAAGESCNSGRLCGLRSMLYPILYIKDPCIMLCYAGPAFNCLERSQICNNVRAEQSWPWRIAYIVELMP